MYTLNSAFASLILLACPAAASASDGAAGPDQALCGTATALAADPLVVGVSGSWSVLVGTAVFTDHHNPVTQVTGLSPGENVLQWILIGDGPPEVDQMTITVHDPAATSAFAGTDSALCLPVDTMHLAATPAASPAIGSWSSVGIALIDVFTDPHSSVEFPNGGTVQMIWTVFNGTCGQVSDTVVITVEECVIGVEEQGGVGVPVLMFDRATGSVLVKNAVARTLVEVIDQSGRSVRSVWLSAVGENRVPLRELASGTYLARVTSGPDARVLRFVIDR